MDNDSTEVGNIDLGNLWVLLDRDMSRRLFMSKEVAKLVDFFEYVQGDTSAYLQIFSDDEAEQRKYLFGTLAILSQECHADHKERWDKISDIHEQMVRALAKDKALKGTDTKQMAYWMASSQIQVQESAKARAKSEIRSTGNRKKARDIENRIQSTPDLEDVDYAGEYEE